MEYFNLLNDIQKSNINVIIESMQNGPINNDFTKAAILAVSSKESSFLLNSEMSYAHTPNDRIRAIFGTHFKEISDDDLTRIKNDPKEFFDDVYGGMYGNAPDEGYKYRARGFHDTTFKGNYIAAAKKLNVDLVNNPDLLNTPTVAAAEMIQYFVDRFAMADEHVKADIHANDINGFTTLEDALVGIYRANAGWAKPIFPDVTGGFAKAHDRVEGFLTMIKNSK